MTMTTTTIVTRQQVQAALDQLAPRLIQLDKEVAATQEAEKAARLRAYHAYELRDALRKLADALAAVQSDGRLDTPAPRQVDEEMMELTAEPPRFVIVQQ
jgi:urease accessory protein UreH